MYNKDVRNDPSLRRPSYAQYNMNASPVLGSKDTVLQAQKFYTPHLNNKKIQNENLNAFIEMKYQSRKLNTKPMKDGSWLQNDADLGINVAQKENNEFLSQMEEENPLVKHLIKSVSNKKGEGVSSGDKLENKKLMKIQTLFKAENFEQVNMQYVMQSWVDLTAIYEHISNSKNPINVIKAFMRNFSPQSHSDFIGVFTDYNHIKQKVKSFYFLKMWACVLFVYINDATQGNFDLKTFTWFEAIFSQLLQDVFYISLIISKALRNNFIRNSKQNVEGFSRHLQKYNFPTGIPLIKTLKTNNENVFLSLKNVIGTLDVSFSMQFEKSYLTDLDNLLDCIKNVVSFFCPLVTPHTKATLETLRSYISSEPQAQPKNQSQLDPTLFTTTTSSKRYTLVFDLDETLIHFKTENSKSKFLIRPHAYNILRNLQPHFEIIIFTAAQKEYADFILNLIDNQAAISHRFYREHCLMAQNCHIKVI